MNIEINNRVNQIYRDTECAKLAISRLSLELQEIQATCHHVESEEDRIEPFCKICYWRWPIR